MFKDKENAQNHALLDIIDEKLAGHWICKNSWSINQLTGYGVTALLLEVCIELSDNKDPIVCLCC